ncbi:MAG TPA: helix-turn-helix domain-containing protein [Solirubrobacterales bacterium]
MNRASDHQSKSQHEIRLELVERLRSRSAEIEDAIFNRVRALASPAESEDAEYRAGLRATVAESVDYALTSIERGEESTGAIPPAAAAQARRSARSGVGLDTVLRRYAAGDRLVGEIIMDEAGRFPNEALRHVLRTQSPHVDRLMASVAAEYMAELELMRRSPSQRLAERVRRLLADDEPFDPDGLDYEFEAWHLGLIVTGAGADVAARTLATEASREALVVKRGEETTWAWLGGRERLEVGEVEGFLAAGALGDVTLAVGEPRWGVDGWRLTHHEAQAAQQVMLRRPRPLIQASNVILLAAVLRDEPLAKSLRQTYLAPLDEHGDSGIVLRETLRAYFAAGFNAATAAAALEIDRHTVQRRLRKVEEALGRLLPSCHAELEVALSLEELDDSANKWLLHTEERV